MLCGFKQFFKQFGVCKNWTRCVLELSQDWYRETETHVFPVQMSNSLQTNSEQTVFALREFIYTCQLGRSSLWDPRESQVKVPKSAKFALHFEFRYKLCGQMRSQS